MVRCFLESVMKRCSIWMVALSLALPSDAKSLPPIDLDTDVAPIVVMEKVEEAVYASISPKANDATLVLRFTMLMANAFFDAIAPYTPTAVGIYSKLGRR